MTRNRKGFIFVETIIVTCVLLASLMVVYAMYVTSLNTESRYTRYDDPVKLYQSYYVTKYLEGFDFRFLIQNIKEDCGAYTTYNTCVTRSTCKWSSNRCLKRIRYDMVWQGRSDLFGNSYVNEALFFDALWDSLRIRNIYVIPNNVSDIVKCVGEEFDAICSNETLLTYLKGLDNGPSNTYYAIFEFASSREGALCSGSTTSCLTYYTYVVVSE